MTESDINRQFVKAWGSIKSPELDSVNPHFRNKYASLGATLSAIREACEPNGIAYLQNLVQIEGRCEFHSFVCSGDGDTIARSVFPVEQPPNPQAFGSNLTYAKRQQAQADWSITGEEDDDANSAAEAAKGTQHQRGSAKPSASEKVSCGGAVAVPQPSKDEELIIKASKRLGEACDKYAKKYDREPQAVKDGVKKRPDYARTADYLNMVAEELEGDL